jgi:hypothetical protein
MNRLNKESASRRLVGIKMMRELLFTNVNFVTDEELRSFTQYTRYQDFVNDRIMRTVKISKESSRLGALLLISNSLNESPLNLRMWIIDRRKNQLTLRVVDDVLVKDLEHRIINLEKYFIQRIEPPAQSAEFDSAFEELRAREQKWIKQLRDTVYSHISDSEENAFLLLSSEDDPAEGCGIGLGNQPLTELQKIDPSAAQELKAEIDALTVNMLKLLEHFQSDMLEEEILVFFKVYDPWNLLPFQALHGHGSASAVDGVESRFHRAALDDSSHNSSDSSDDSDKEDSHDGGKQGAAGDAVEQGTVDKPSEKAAAGEDGNAAEPKKVQKRAKLAMTKEYLPMKYLGSLNISRDGSEESLKDSVLKLLRLIAAASNGTLPPEWMERDAYRIFLSDSPMNISSLVSLMQKFKMDYKPYSLEALLAAKVRTFFPFK